MLPIGEVGEVCLRGGFMKGYWGKPDKTAEAMRGGWLHTGDAGVMDRDGYVTMRGRFAELIKVGGRTWFPRDVEEALCAQPGVKEAAVVALPDAELGQRPVAFVTIAGRRSICRVAEGRDRAAGALRSRAADDPQSRGFPDDADRQDRQGRPAPERHRRGVVGGDDEGALHLRGRPQDGTRNPCSRTPDSEAIPDSRFAASGMTPAFFSGASALPRRRQPCAGPAAITSTSTRNSGRENPVTIISVEAGGGSAM